MSTRAARRSSYGPAATAESRRPDLSAGPRRGRLTRWGAPERVDPWPQRPALHRGQRLRRHRTLGADAARRPGEPRAAETDSGLELPAPRRRDLDGVLQLHPRVLWASSARDALGLPQLLRRVRWQPADQQLRPGQLDRSGRDGDRGRVARALQRPRPPDVGTALEVAPAPELRLVRAGRPACVLLRRTGACDIPVHAAARTQRPRGLRRPDAWGRAVASEILSHSSRDVRPRSAPTIGP